MSLFDALPQHRGTSAHRGEEDAATALSRSFPTDNLAPGIVWANVLADIAADERAHRRQGLPGTA